MLFFFLENRLHGGPDVVDELGVVDIFQSTHPGADSPQFLTVDFAEIVAGQDDLDPWGAGRATNDHPVFFAGHLVDPVAGLVPMRARWYDPSLGRFLTPDPAGLAAGPNAYVYVSGRPLSLVDPLGLQEAAPEEPGLFTRFGRWVGDTAAATKDTVVGATEGLGYLTGVADIEEVVVGATPQGVPIRLASLGRVTIGPAVRRGIAELDGRGDAVGGIVVMRAGENALTTIERVKARLEELQPGLPDGVVILPTYDRSDLIDRAIGTLTEKLIEESIIVALVCIIFLLHARSALVAILTLPVGILMGFVAMRWIGVGADIMSLGGIAIAIGAMIDAAIVMVENMHKHLERAVNAKARSLGMPIAGRWVETSLLTSAERRAVVSESAREVGPALFFSLLIITVSFLPVFTLEGQEGRLFHPLAFTKTFAMAAASLLAVTLIPVTMDLFIRGRVYREAARARIRVLVKRILRKYGYPPDLQDAAVQTVLQQAEALSAAWAA